MTKNLIVTLLILLSVIAVSWLYLFYQHWQMTSLPMADMWMPPAEAGAWQWPDFWLVYVMWAVMMAAMMLPSAIPMILAYARICTQRYHRHYPYTLIFALAYLLVWLSFSIALTVLQWQLHGLKFLSPMMDVEQQMMAAFIFLLAGIYQFTPLKSSFLGACRTPVGFLLTEWREGVYGAFSMGLKHGGDCLGCCWAQMLIMFAVGVMSLIGMALITMLGCMEKILPVNPNILSKAIGILFILWSIWLF